MTLKVLHSVRSLHSADGGPARSVPALAAAEAAAGASVRLWTSDKPTISVREYDSVEFLNGPIDQCISETWTPDVIHDHGLWLPTNHSAARLGRHQRIPRVVSPRGMLEPWCLNHKKYRKLLAWQMYQYRDLRSCSCLHSTSEAEARQFRRLGLQQPIVLLPNGVELPDDKSGKFPHEDSDDAGNSVRREVLFLSRIHPVKGLPNLIKAWKSVANPDWVLKIVGSDEEGHKKEILGLIKDLNLQDTIIVEDAVYGDQKWALLKKADVVVLPSYSENFGIVVAESLSVGTPIITTTGTPWERVVSEGCGWFVAPTIEGMAIGLGSAMRQSQTQLSQMGNLGRAWVQKEFGWRDIGNKMIAAYQFLLGRDQTCSWIEHSPEGRRAA